MFLRIYIVFVLLSSFSAFSQGSGNALSFNGINRYVDLGTNVGTGVRTIEVWFKPEQTIDNSIGDAIGLIARDYDNGNGANLNEFGFWFNPGWSGTSGSLNFMRRVGSSYYFVQSDQAVWEAGHWYHAAAVIDPNNGMKMYINGVLQSDTDPTVQAVQPQSGSASDMVAIGTWGYWGVTSGTRFFEGEIDEVRFWDNARSQTQIREKMCSKLVGNESGLRLYYEFNNTSGNTLSDSGPFGSNGTLINFASNPWHYSSAPIGDTSTYVYATNFSGVNLSLNYSVGDAFKLSNITGNGLGAHIYRVNSLPNMQSGLPANSSTSYYGAFLTGNNGSYSIEQDISYSATCASACNALFSRNDNASTNWTTLAATFNNCTGTKTNESNNGNSFREEYILASQNNNFIPLSDASFCEGGFLVLNAGAGYSSYLWQNTVNSQFLTVNQSGNYFVELTSSCGVLRDTVFVEEMPYPIIILPSDSVFCKAASVLVSSNLNGVSYLWSSGETTSEITLNSEGEYVVTATYNGCSTSDTIHVVFNNSNNEVVFPNIITPNNDGINDYFSFEKFQMQKIHYSIYNRWGLLVFESDSKFDKWYGKSGNKICDDGTYFVITEYTMECGLNEVIKEKLFITLIK